MHIFNITGLECKVTVLAAVRYWARTFFQLPVCAAPLQRLSASRLPSCSSVGFIVTYNVLTRLLLLSSCLFTALLVFIFILLSLERSL